MRLLTSLFVLAATVAPSFAGSPCTDRIPPTKYQFEPAAPYTVLFRSATVIKMMCGTKNAFGHPPIACADTETNTIYIVTGRSRQHMACLLVHEKAHLNGWPAHHPKN